MNPRFVFTLPEGLPLTPPWTWPCVQGTTSTLTPEQLALGASKCTVTIRNSNIHPIFKQLMASYISHFRSIQLKTLLKAANITEEHLPTLPKYMRNEKKQPLLYIHSRQMPRKMCGKAPDGHTPGGGLPNTFVQEPCTMLTPGVEKRLETGPPTTQYQFAWGYSSKMYK